MSASVRVNYDRFVNTGLVPASDYENAVMDEILDWADETLHPETKIELPALIDLYWAVQFGEVEIEFLTDDEGEDTESEDAGPMSATVLEFTEN